MTSGDRRHTDWTCEVASMKRKLWHRAALGTDTAREEKARFAAGWRSTRKLLPRSKHSPLSIHKQIFELQLLYAFRRSTVLLVPLTQPFEPRASQPLSNVPAPLSAMQAVEALVVGAGCRSDPGGQRTAWRCHRPPSSCSARPWRRCWAGGSCNSCPSRTSPS